MFTIRFNQHDGGYKAYSVSTYIVTRESSAEVRVAMSRKLNGQDEYIEYVGDHAPFAVAYITNLDGKTIDVIRSADAVAEIKHQPKENPNNE